MNTSAQNLLKRGIVLEYLTLSWNVVGTVIVLVSAWQARSVALAGFGLDSLIEIFASTVVLWQLGEHGLERERPALRRIGVAFYLLAGYIALQTLFSLLSGVRAGVSVGGLLWLLSTFVAMLWLSSAKRQVGQRLGNPVLLAEARVTLVDAVLAGAVFIGVALNAALGWSWADSLAALFIVYYAVREGRHALQEANS